MSGSFPQPLFSFPYLATCQPPGFAVVSELPIKRLTRFSRVGQSKLAAELNNTSPGGPIISRFAWRRLVEEGHQRRKRRSRLAFLILGWSRKRLVA